MKRTPTAPNAAPTISYGQAFVPAISGTTLPIRDGHGEEREPGTPPREEGSLVREVRALAPVLVARAHRATG